MKIDLTKLNSSRLDIEKTIGAEALEFEDDSIQVKSDLEFGGKLSSKEHWTLLEGRIQGKIETDCGRCLEPIKNELDLDFSRVFIAPENYDEKREDELVLLGIDVSFIETNEIDLKEVAKEEVLLSLPSQTICREGCKGICSDCGTNLNIGACECEGKKTDSRWDALNQLKTKD